MSFLKGASVYLASNLLNAVIPFLLLPILTRYLSPAEYGQIAMFQTLLAGIGTFIGLNAVGAANRKFYDRDINDIVLKRFNGSCIHILIISSLVVFICIYLFKVQISYFLAIPISWILAAVVISVLGFITSMRLGQWQIRSQAKWFGILQVSSSLINMLLSLLFIVILKQEAQGRIDAQLITGFITALVGLLWLYKDKLIEIRRIDKEYIKEALFFGIPLIPHGLGLFFITSVDRFVINSKLGLVDAGIYMVAAQLSSALVVIFDAINKAYVPWLFERLSNNNSKEKSKIVYYTYIYFVLVLVVALIAFLIGPFLITLIAGDKYKLSGELIGWLCLGQVFGGMYLMVTNYIFYAKKTAILSMVTIGSGFVNIILLYIFVDKYGLAGAAYSFVITKFIQFGFTWLLSSRVVSMPWFTKIQ